MSAGITSCCAPVAAAPVTPQQPVVEGGGPPSKDAIVGGGPEQGGTTCFETAPEPVQCGQLIPAPVAGPGTPSSAPTPAPAPGPDTPPDPIEAPATAPDAPASAPASSRPTWPEWQQYFTRLGVSEQDLAKIGGANLNDEQLAQVYTDIHESVVASGGTPGQTPVTGAPAWDAEWDQKFAALGLPAAFVAELKAEALRTGADDAKLEAIHQQLATTGRVPGQSAWSAEWEQKFLALGLPAEFIAELKQQALAEGASAEKLAAVYEAIAGKVGGPQPTTPQQEGPGWNAEIEQAFRALGMPDEVIKLYAESGAPRSGLEAAYAHAAGRLEDFTKRGWMQKFEAAGVPPLTTWEAILGTEPISDKDAQKLLDTYEKSQRSKLERGGQLATSLFPGGRLLQYALGRELVSGDKIDRTDWKEIGFAALSGLAAFATIRGAKTIGQGWAARGGNFAQMNQVNDTLRSLKLPNGTPIPAGEVEAMQQAAMGATQTWGLKQKLLSIIPGTTLHKEVVGFAHTEAAAKAFNNGGAKAMLDSGADGALQLATMTKLFDDIKTGTTAVHGGKVAYLGPFSMKKTPLMSLGALKDGRDVINVAKNLKVGNGNAQLVGFMEMAGSKLGASKGAWLTNAANLSDDIYRLSDSEQKLLGRVMAGNLANDLGGASAFSKDGIRPLKHLKEMMATQARHTPDWYADLATATAAQWPKATGGSLPQMPEELFERLMHHKLFSSIFDEADAIAAGIDRSKLTPEAAAALDESLEAMSKARAGWETVRSGASIDEVGAVHATWRDSIAKLHETDAELAEQVFAKMVQRDSYDMATVAAGDAVRAEWAASLPKVADDVADAAADAAQGMPAATNAVDDVVDGAVSATSSPVVLHTNARGEAVTEAGLIVPSYAGVVNQPVPSNVTDPAIARLAEAMQRLRA